MKPTRRPCCGLIITAALTVVLGGCASHLTEQQRVCLAEGQQYYERGDYGRAIDQLSRFLAEVREGPEVARALYVRGMSQAQVGRRPQAYADLRRCAALPIDSDAIWRSHVVLGTLHLEDQHWDQAAQNLRIAAERMPAAPPRDAVLYRLGLCLERAGRWGEARQHYREIAESFGSGNYADAARRRLQINADHFAVQCGAFREQSNAETLCGNLKRKGLAAYVHREVRGRTPLHVVLIGRYTTYEEALSQRAMVREFVPDAILWP